LVTHSINIVAVFMQLAPGLPWSRGPWCFKTSKRTGRTSPVWTHPEESQKYSEFQHNKAISKTANTNAMKWPWSGKAWYG